MVGGPPPDKEPEFSAGNEWFCPTNWHGDRQRPPVDSPPPRSKSGTQRCVPDALPESLFVRRVITDLPNVPEDRGRLNPAGWSGDR